MCGTIVFCKNEIFCYSAWLAHQNFRHGAVRVLGESEVRSLENDVIQPVESFIDEVYEDSVGDAKKRILRKR